MIRILDFYADWCGPCHAMKPVLDKVIEKHKDKFELIKVNVDEQQEEAQKYGIMSIPTLVLIDAGSGELDRRMGAMGESQLESWLLQFAK